MWKNPDARTLTRRMKCREDFDLPPAGRGLWGRDRFPGRPAAFCCSPPLEAPANTICLQKWIRTAISYWMNAFPCRDSCSAVCSRIRGYPLPRNPHDPSDVLRHESISSVRRSPLCRYHRLHNPRHNRCTQVCLSSLQQFLPFPVLAPSAPGLPLRASQPLRHSHIVNPFTSAAMTGYTHL